MIVPPRPLIDFLTLLSQKKEALPNTSQLNIYSPLSQLSSSILSTLSTAITPTSNNNMKDITVALKAMARLDWYSTQCITSMIDALITTRLTSSSMEYVGDLMQSLRVLRVHDTPLLRRLVTWYKWMLRQSYGDTTTTNSSSRARPYPPEVRAHLASFALPIAELGYTSSSLIDIVEGALQEEEGNSHPSDPKVHLAPAIEGPPHIKRELVHDADIKKFIEDNASFSWYRYCLYKNLRMSYDTTEHRLVVVWYRIAEAQEERWVSINQQGVMIGSSLVKVRHLISLGWKVVPVWLSEWSDMKSDKDRAEYMIQQSTRAYALGPTPDDDEGGNHHLPSTTTDDDDCNATPWAKRRRKAVTITSPPPSIALLQHHQLMRGKFYRPFMMTHMKNVWSKLKLYYLIIIIILFYYYHNIPITAPVSSLANIEVVATATTSSSGYVFGYIDNQEVTTQVDIDHAGDDGHDDGRDDGYEYHGDGDEDDDTPPLVVNLHLVAHPHQKYEVEGRNEVYARPVYQIRISPRYVKRLEHDADDNDVDEKASSSLMIAGDDHEGLPAAILDSHHHLPVGMPIALESFHNIPALPPSSSSTPSPLPLPPPFTHDSSIEGSSSSSSSVDDDVDK
ncbi:hypothetical protein FOZ60_003297 [Perkinsus olseni]|uniref:RAP domain-containing protein n=1 Tax=Perkinsus olseni TaxID=32597 RepID=A0A7J6NVW5_PEROL|nr:hypothetical protein FOZ60_003297 [Perkinsus olseni]